MRGIFLEFCSFQLSSNVLSGPSLWMGRIYVYIRLFDSHGRVLYSGHASYGCAHTKDSIV